MKAKQTIQPASVNALTPRASSRLMPRPFHAFQVDQREERKENRTGLPDTLKAGIENLSGISLDDVKVHYGSSKPSKLDAHAYTQSNTIHVGPGQERHLAHEAWHVVQQKQGRVRPTAQLNNHINLNDAPKLENEAVMMGARALTDSARSHLISGDKFLLRKSQGQAPITPAIPSAPVVQRDVVDDFDRSRVVLDRFNRDVEMAQVITASLFQKLWRSGVLGDRTFDSVFDDVMKKLPGMIDVIQSQSRIIGLSELVESHFKDELEEHFAQMAVGHEKWLKSAKTNPLVSHENMLDPKSKKYFGHYNLFDKNMIWRFTTRPSTETVYIAPATSHEEVNRVIAAHSGGADKSNPNVKTLSFGRNLGALVGVAASKGGDKKVLNIADKAEYLYGINIDRLARIGISAHPATARLISLFETEYVLVSTPGDRPRSLDELATVKYKNPFKNAAIQKLLSDRSEMKGVEETMPAIEHETVSGVQEMDSLKAAKILRFAKKAKVAASKQTFAVQDKEPASQKITVNAMEQYNKDLMEIRK